MFRSRTGFAVVCSFLSFSFLQSQSRAQANVDESQETAWVFVDAAHGSDSNPGTKQKPVQTLNQAASLSQANNWKGIGTRVIVNPGTYRETLSIHGTQRDTSLPITYQAATKGTAIVTGADVWDGWQQSQKNPKLYSHNWPYRWGLCPLDGGDAPAETDIVRRREMIFVNGKAMTQVLSPSAMRVSTFYINESASTVQLWPPNGTTMSQAKVEVATRDLTVDVGLKQNLVFRGMTFKQASSCRGGSAVYIHGSSNVLVDQNYFYWNNAAGLKILNVQNTTVQNSLAEHNGTSGMKGRQTKHDLWQNNRAFYNDWRGAQGVYYKWGEGGFHFALAHGENMTNMHTAWNQTSGVHWDIDNENVIANEIIAAQNLLSETVVERTQGPLTISNSHFCNGKPLTGPNTFGFQLRNSSYVTLTGSYMRGNNNEIGVTGDAGGLIIPNWETGQNIRVIDKNFTSTNNAMDAYPDQQTFNDGMLGGADWTLFHKTLVSDYNTWWNESDPEAFMVPTPDPWTKLDFPGWKQASNGDVHSVWKVPGDPGRCSMTPDGPDFWFITNYLEGWQTIKQGESVTFTGYVIPLAFHGDVELSSDGVLDMPGAQGKWSQKQIQNSGTATFTITTSNSTPRKTYPVTLIANSGNLTRTMTVTVVVQ